MPPRSSRGPTSLHLASLGSPFALLTGLCPPPPRFASLSSCCPSVFSHPTASLSLAHPFTPPTPRSSLAVHARARSVSRAPRLPSRSRAPSFLFLPSAAVSSLSLSATSFARLDLILPCPFLPPVRRPRSRPAPAPCSSSSAPTEHSHRPFVYESTEKRLIVVSSRLVSLDSFALFVSFPCLLLLLLPLPSFFLSACSPSAAFSSFVLQLSFPLPPYRSPSLSLSPFYSLFARARTRRSINYSKNSYCYYYRLTIPSAGARDGHSSPVQCATLFAPRRLRRQPDGGASADGDDESWTSGTSSVVPAGETRIDFTRVTFFL